MLHLVGLSTHWLLCSFINPNSLRILLLVGLLVFKIAFVFSALQGEGIQATYDIKLLWSVYFTQKCRKRQWFMKTQAYLPKDSDLFKHEFVYVFRCGEELN